MEPTSNRRLRKIILQIVENQLRDGTPPETQATLHRLMADGYPRDRAIEMIGCVLTNEVYDVLESKKPYNEQRFIAALRALPTMPWEQT